ncbi:MAG: AMP-binding protein [Betaproteobacteria bacterium]|nr:AMP-binding protein [Betaproteobacteria bacterium]
MNKSLENFAEEDAGTANSLRDIALGELLREAARAAGGRLALVDGVEDPALRKRWTYNELLAEAEQVARALLARFKQGDRIAICSPNSAQWVIFEYGVALAGMVVVPVNADYRQSELAGVLQDCDAAALFYADKWRKNDIAANAMAVRDGEMPNLVLMPLAEWDEFLKCGSPDTPLPNVHHRDPVAILFTSGTTGRPKGAMLHHGISNPPRSVADCCNFRQHGVFMNPTPMHHISGSAVTLFAALSRHGTFVQMSHWDPVLAMELIESEGVNGALLVPTMIVALLDHPDCGKHDLSSLDFLVTGAAPVPPALLDRVKQRIGCPVLICFGQTESGGPVSNTTLTDGAEELAKTLGRALPGLEIEIFDTETGTKLPAGEIGEICFRGPQIMLGYYGREDATKEAITPDGWLRSGDLGTLDERGYLAINGRLKDMIIRGGSNIYPREIEDALFALPSVAQAAVIGVPDDKWGEVVLAVVQAAEGSSLDFGEMFHYCRERMAPYKVPALWCEIDEFPLNPSGKIQKFELANWVRDGKLTPVAVR